MDITRCIAISTRYGCNTNALYGNISQSYMCGRGGGGNTKLVYHSSAICIVPPIEVNVILEVTHIDSDEHHMAITRCIYKTKNDQRVLNVISRSNTADSVYRRKNTVDNMEIPPDIWLFSVKNKKDIILISSSWRHIDRSYHQWYVDRAQQ